MNYRHAFHAGNHADVLKHLSVVAILQHLTRKDSPFFALDTHAGRGMYSVVAAQAQKTGEAEAGIGRLLAEAPNDPLVHDYLKAVKAARAELKNTTVYPGSPCFLLQAMRQQDRLALTELNPEEYTALETNFRHDRRVVTSLADGYAALRSQLPPRTGNVKIARGLVLIDPPFEAQLAEFDTIIAGLRSALERWPLATYAVWYPIKLRRSIQPFLRRAAALPVRNALNAELLVRNDDTPLRMNGSGMLILNAPYQLDTQLRASLSKIAPILADGPGATSSVSWIVEPA